MGGSISVRGLTQRCAFHTRPGPNLGVRTDDGIHDTGIVTNFHIVQENRVLDADASRNESAGANRDIGANDRGGMDQGRGMDVARLNESGLVSLFRGIEGLWTRDKRAALGESARDSLHKVLEVGSVGGQSGGAGLDLEPEVPVAVTGKGVQGLLGDQKREDVLFQHQLLGRGSARKVLGKRGGSFCYFLGSSALQSVSKDLENGVIEQVDTTGDDIGNERFFFMSSRALQ